MVSNIDIGISGPTYRFPIEEGKTHEFAAAVGATNPVYFEEKTPLIPPTFLGISGRFWGYTFDEPGNTPLAEVDIDRSLLLHAEEEYDFPNGLPRAGTELFARTYIQDVREKEGKRGGKMTFVVSETEYKTESGEIACLSRMTVVRTENAAG